MRDAFSSHISPILDDQAATKDTLNFTPYVDALSDILLDENTRTPLTLGIYGPWGSGKTSLMAMLKKRLDDRRREKRRNEQAESARWHLTVWFSAWLYGQEESLWRTLILRVLAELRREIGSDPAARQSLDKIETNLTRSAESASLGELILDGQALTGGSDQSAQFRLPLATGLELLQKAAAAKAAADADAKDTSQETIAIFLQTIKQRHAALNRERVEALESFRQDFQSLIEQHIYPGFLIVFIDDLDRCLPEKVLQVLEAIKIFLDMPGCIFVLGLDPEAIQEAVKTRYQDEKKARQYLEKIIQLPFLLPPIEAEATRNYIESLTPSSSLPDARCAEVFAQGLVPNPRQVKRTINVFLLLSRLVARQLALSHAITPVRLAKLVTIQHSHPDFYAQLREVPRLLRDLEIHFRAEDEHKILITSDAPEKEQPETPLLPPQLQTFAGRTTLRRLLTMHPQNTPDVNFDDLTPQDIRPYIYLTHRIETRLEIRTDIPWPEMVRIPAGEFTMGDKEHSDERPVRTIYLPGFQIGRYPVTNYEYRAFVRDTGTSPPLHWEGNNYPETLGDHPVVYVTWHDATAYCLWLGDKTGQPYRLPTEAEWEKAARSSDRRKWPWGDEWDASKCNSKESGQGGTTPTGQYSPDGDSPFSVADMAGNVWEWCQSMFWPYPYHDDDGREDLNVSGERVLRGGAYSSERDSMRCAFRSFRLPQSRDKHAGFRLVLSLPTHTPPDRQTEKERR